PVIVVPRLKKYDEHVNDHQIEITKELEKQGRILGVYDISELKEKINKVEKMKSKSFPKPRIPGIIENFIKSSF
ncbi:MAG: beta-1,4-galactosyltransferase, partial [Candidatus Aenigmarchaeota archaeon]|nr:beta-1,4-galactosyltransferase [Candidatus Aenigmarchaeota archaeon]